MQAVPLVIGQFLEMVDNNTGIVGSTTGSNYYVRILSTLNRQGRPPRRRTRRCRARRRGAALGSVASAQRLCSQRAHAWKAGCWHHLA